MSLLKLLIESISSGKRKGLKKRYINRYIKHLKFLRDETHSGLYDSFEYTAKDMEMNFQDFVAKVFKDDINEIIDLVLESDPTKKKKYANWLIDNTFVEFESEKKKARQKTIKEFHNNNRGSIKRNLHIFQLLKDRGMVTGSEADINQYDFDSLDKKVEPYKSDIDFLGTRKQVMEESSEFIYEKDRLQIIVPKSYEASCYWGTGTKWCTAVDDGDSTSFDEYTMGNKNLFIFIDDESEKFQLHFNKNGVEFTDKENTNGINQFYDMYKNDPIFYESFLVCSYYDNKDKEFHPFQMLDIVIKALQEHGTIYWRDLYRAIDENFWKVLYDDTKRLVDNLREKDNLSRYIEEIYPIVQYLKRNDKYGDQLVALFMDYELSEIIRRNSFENVFIKSKKELTKFLDGLMK